MKTKVLSMFISSLLVFVIPIPLVHADRDENSTTTKASITFIKKDASSGGETEGENSGDSDYNDMDKEEDKNINPVVPNENAELLNPNSHANAEAHPVIQQNYLRDKIHTGFLPQTNEKDGFLLVLSGMMLTGLSIFVLRKMRKEDKTYENKN